MGAEKCSNLPQKKCEMIEKEKCIPFPSKKCATETKVFCQYVTREECCDDTIEVCKSIPEKVCSQSVVRGPRQVCTPALPRRSIGTCNAKVTVPETFVGA